MSKEDFENTWLFEMPMGIKVDDAYSQLVNSIKDRINYGSKVINIADNLHKILGINIEYYWYGTIDHVILGAEIEIKPYGLVVQLVGKDPSYKGMPPYASDLYDVILKDNHRSIRLMSDDKLSDEGYNIWKKLYSLGHKITVYNKLSPGQTFQTFSTVTDMDQFFKHNDYSFTKYQFVLSESGEVLAETRSIFNTRRYRELAGLA